MVALPLAALLLAPAPALAQQTTAVDPDPWFGKDKALHATAGVLIAGGAYGASVPYTDQIALRIAFGAGLSVAAGGAKELFDLAGYGDPSWKDFTWDVVGAAIGVGVAVTLDLAFREPSPVRAR
ncbi:MAG: hypothetical protein U0359_16755 [Byssovorax sp.]